MSHTDPTPARTRAGNSPPLSRLFSDSIHFNIFLILLLIAAASLPFTNFLMLPVAGLMLVNWAAEWNWKDKWRNMRQNATPATLITLFSIYLIVIYGFFLSYNKGRALAAFDCNLWFLVAPLVLLSYSRKELNNNRIHLVLLVFALSTFAHVLILFSIAIPQYIRTGEDIYLYYGHLSRFRHPSYIAMYATFSFFFLVDFLNKTHQRLPLASRVALYMVLATLLTGVFFLQSKAGLLVFGILTAVWFVYLLFIRNTNIAAALSVIVVVTSVCIVLHETQWVPVHRFRDTIEDVGRFKANRLGSGSSEIRLTVWKSAVEICKKNMPWGVGTGDATDELCVNAVKKNYTNLIGHHFNAHNQYLQTLLTTGIPGILALLAYCLMPLVTSLRRKNTLYFSFAVILILNIVVESMFETRGGVDFFAIMNVLLLLRSK